MHSGNAPVTVAPTPGAGTPRNSVKSIVVSRPSHTSYVTRRVSYREHEEGARVPSTIHGAQLTTLPPGREHGRPERARRAECQRDGHGPEADRRGRR